jgi:hypothetical protein
MPTLLQSIQVTGSRCRWVGRPSGPEEADPDAVVAAAGGEAGAVGHHATAHTPAVWPVRMVIVCPLAGTRTRPRTVPSPMARARLVRDGRAGTEPHNGGVLHLIDEQEVTMVDVSANAARALAGGLNLSGRLRHPEIRQLAEAWFPPMAWPSCRSATRLCRRGRWERRCFAKGAMEEAAKRGADPYG